MEDVWIGLVWRAALILTFAVSLFVVRHLATNRRWLAALRSRFYLGVPWGSIVSLGLVLFVYLVVQEGALHWDEPLAVPFSAWSYFYPLGWLFAGFAHASPAHLTSNLTSAVVLAPAAEYVWGHYPDSRSETEPRYDDPRIRAFVLFPSFVLAAGVFTSLFSWGPVIGFSGVVFAFAGFVLVRYPILAVVVLAGRSAAHTIRAALGEPITVVEVTATVSTPWWYGIAVQGHAIGLLLGVIAGVVLLRRRRIHPDPLRLWLGSLLVGLGLSLWAIWWVRGASTFVLYRALGVALVVAMATLIAATLAANDRPLVGGLTRQQVGLSLLVLPMVVMCLVAVPFNLTVVDAQSPDDAITTGDYVVFYDEEVEDRMFSVVDIELFGETTDVTTSGVIVVNGERQVWGQEVSKVELQTYGDGVVRVGGLTWSETIEAERDGWVVDGEPVYRVWLEHDGERTLAYTSDPANARGAVAGHEVGVATGDRFEITLDGEARAPVPDPGESVAVEGIEFVREVDGDVDGEGDVLYAVVDETRMPIAVEETYTPRQEDL